MDEKQLEQVLSQMELDGQIDSITRFYSEEDGEGYNVWRINAQGQAFVLKIAKGFEAETYQTFFNKSCPYAPRLYSTVHTDDADYLLMEYVLGNDLRKCARQDLIRALDSLIAMQDAHWMDTAHADCGQSFTRSLPGRRNRGNYLNDPQLEAAYGAFLREYAALPRSLCHDDLLPFNVLISGDRAVFIDWEYGGILPYPTSLARLIAHGEEQEDAFFFLKEEDKAFALTYYFEHFIQAKGIRRNEYLRSMKLFLFYEYCEWVYLGNKFRDTDSLRFRNYFHKAKEAAKELGY